MTRREWAFLGRLWRQVIGWLVAIVLITTAGMAAKALVPLALAKAFDAMGRVPGAPELGAAALAYLGIGLAERVLTGSLVFLRAALNSRFEWLTRTRAFAALVRLGPGFLQRHRTGDLVTRLTDDVTEKFAWFACSGVFRAFAASATIVFAFVAMFRVDARLALITAAPLPLLALLHVRTSASVERRWESVQANLSGLNSALESCFTGIRVVKAYGRELGEEEVFALRARACAEAEVAAARRQALMDALYGQGWQVAVAAVLLAGGLQVMAGDMTIGTLVAFDAYAFLLAWPMIDIGAFLVRGRQASVSIGRLLEIEDAEPDVREAPAPALAPAGPRGALAFEAVSVVLGVEDGAREVLSDVSFDVRPGERVALVGAVGAGKSTLLRLPSRLLDPSRGRLLVDGLDAREWPIADLRRIVGFAPQEAALFSGTVADNVRFGRREVDDAAIAWAVRVARLEKDLEQWRDGLRTTVGVRGVTVSGGQAQRIALARALAGQPRLLVLDDVTSALDAETEAALWAELATSLPGLTVLFATHRTATLQRADRIVVLEGGRIAETGRHDALVRTGGAYAELHARRGRG